MMRRIASKGEPSTTAGKAGSSWSTSASRSRRLMAQTFHAKIPLHRSLADFFLQQGQQRLVGRGALGRAGAAPCEP